MDDHGVQAGQQRRSYEELADLVVAQARVIEQLRVEVAELRADNERLRTENAELERRLGMNSTNSSADAVEVGVTRRQVFDLPEIAVRVTEHQVVARRCDCGKVTGGVAPAGVDAPVSYGPRIAAITVYLYLGQFLSKKRTAQALAELFGRPFCTGTVASITRRAAAGLNGFRELVRGAITAAEVVHFDETGLRVEGKLRWVHSASTGKYALIWVHDKRGRVAMDAAGVLPAFTGTAVHDAWAPYDCYRSATHALCNAHLLRELVAVTDTVGLDERGWCWAQQVRTALLEMKALADQAVTDGKSAIDPAVGPAHRAHPIGRVDRGQCRLPAR